MARSQHADGDARRERPDDSHLLPVIPIELAREGRMRSVAWLCIFAGVLLAVVVLLRGRRRHPEPVVGAVGTERQESPGAASR
jgi:hypothetical protein